MQVPSVVLHNICVYTDFTQEYRTELEYIKLKIANILHMARRSHCNITFGYWDLGIIAKSYLKLYICICKLYIYMGYGYYSTDPKQ